MKKITLLAIPILLTACAHSLTLMPRGQGAMAYGSANEIGHTVTIVLNGRTYDGKYAYVQGGSFTLASGSSGTNYATASATSISATGNGNVLAHSADGHNLRCVFNYSSMGNQGVGVCQLDDGHLYDLQIG